MRALFGRKIENIVDLREATERSRKSGMKGTVYTVDREVEMTDDEFSEFGKDFLQDQPWILKTDGGYNEKGEYRCIRVRNVDTGERCWSRQRALTIPGILRLSLMTRIS